MLAYIFNSQTKVMHTRTNKDTTSHLWI